MIEDHDHHLGLTIVGLIFTIVGVLLISIALYITPHIFFNLHYDVPGFVIRLTTWYQEQHGLSGITRIISILLPFLLGGILCLWIAKYISDEADEIKRVVKEESQVAYAKRYTQDDKANAVNTKEFEGEGEGLLETSVHDHPIEYSKKQTRSMVWKLGLVIVLVIVMITLIEYILLV